MLLLPIINDQPVRPAIYYYGKVYKYTNNPTNAETGGFGGYSEGIIIPRASVSIPSNASSITFNFQFDLNGPIVQYGTGAGAVFVLANEFWHRYSLTTKTN